jgi:hypothetical protein
MPAPILQFKRGNAGVAGTVPALRPGEPAISLNNYDFYIGIDTSVANNKFFGSHRYWGRENGTESLRLKLVDRNGTNSVNVKAPNTVAGVTTYTLPELPVNGYVLTTNSSGVLSWTNSLPGGVISGVTTFTDTTDNTLGNSNTGAIQIDGGVGIDKNLTVGAGLNVQGNSEFIGIVTFRGGTINIGDSNTDNINIAGEFVSNLVPNNDNTYDVGIGTQRWRNAAFSGIGTFATGAVIDGVQIGITAAGEIDTTAGNNLILDSSTGQTIIDDNLSVTGITTITGNLIANGNVTLGDAAGDAITINGTATFTQTLVATATTATRATTVDTTTAPTGTFYPGLFVNATGVAGTAVYVDAGISYVTNTDTLTLTGDLAVNGGDLTSTSGTFNLINANSTSVNFAGAATALVMGSATGITTVSNNLTVGGDVRVNGNDIQSSTGAAVITLATNNATFANDVTVSGNLYVNGATTQVNTASLTVEDRTIDLGIVNGAAPASNTTWDLGLLFNYYSAGAAKKSAVIWEHTDSRFKFASVLSGDTEGTDVNTPQLTVTTFAPIEVSELWVNNTCTGGTQQIIGCIGAELNLQNIVVDAGTF